MNLMELTTRQTDEWLRVIERCAPYDFYHLPEYHALAEAMGEGEARLLVYMEGEHVIAFPLLLRGLDDVAAVAAIGPGWKDATSVYGYPGPIASAEPIPSSVIANFQAALRERLNAWRVVTVFSRFNPFLAQRRLVAGLGDFHVRQTVSIDLTLPVPVQRTRYRRSLKESINKLRRLGLTVVRDADGEHMPTFVRIYHETMNRVDAAERYFFPESYFTALRETLGARLEMFMCFHEGRPICGGLLVACHGILQYHLGGTLNDALELAPMKLVVDEARLWGGTQGMRVLHLGGGMTADPDDPLLFFKRGFSDRAQEFAAWRWVVAPEQDRLLQGDHAERLAGQGLRPGPADFFPAYRCPGVPSAQAEISDTPQLLVSGGAS